MHVEIRKADISNAHILTNFDAKILQNSDAFDDEDWLDLECFFLLVDGNIVGTTAVRHNSGVWEAGEYPFVPKCLYIVSTGILPEYRGKGWGLFLKAWQIAYAREYSFKKIVTNCRISNTRIIHLNRKFGFHDIRSIADYYDDPDEVGLVMELELKR